MATQSWAQVTTVAPACAPMARAVDASFLTAVTCWVTSWCVCAARATKVHTHTPVTFHSIHQEQICFRVNSLSKRHTSSLHTQTLQGLFEL